jgi:hypothetical protein
MNSSEFDTFLASLPPDTISALPFSERVRLLSPKKERK